MDDLIDRKEAIKVISNDNLDVKCFCVIGRGQENRELAKTINDYVDLLLETAKRKILSLPKADTKRHAHWIEDKDITELTLTCNCCGYSYIEADSNCEERYDFCPHCGCKMEEVVGNE